MVSHPHIIKQKQEKKSYEIQPCKCHYVTFTTVCPEPVKNKTGTDSSSGGTHKFCTILRVEFQKLRISLFFDKLSAAVEHIYVAYFNVFTYGADNLYGICGPGHNIADGNIK